MFFISFDIVQFYRSKGEKYFCVATTVVFKRSPDHLST